jgi:hypothetical protein
VSDVFRLSSTQGEGYTFEEAIADAVANRERAGLTAKSCIVISHRIERAGDPSRLWHTVDTAADIP